jgi:hypothetical protein
MKTLVKKSGGKLGQNMNDLVVAMRLPEFASDPVLVKAAEHLSALGGVAMTKKKKHVRTPDGKGRTAKGGETKQVGGASQDSPFVQKAIRGKKGAEETGSQSIRGMTGRVGPRRAQKAYKESIDHDKLVEMVRNALIGKDL